MKIEQKTKYKGDNWWEWSVWVEGGKEELKQIEYVEYILHPSFAEPVQRIKNRSSKFRLDSSAWGEFTIHAVIVKKNGEKKNLRHHLDLRYPANLESKVGRGLSTVGAAAQQPVLFLSCNIADSLFANALSKALIAKGARVFMVADEPSGLPWQASINRLLDQTDFAVFIISEGLSIWMSRELEAADEHKVPIVPVIIVSDKLKLSELPERFREGIRIKAVAPEKFDHEAHHVANRIYTEIKTLNLHSTHDKAVKAG